MTSTLEVDVSNLLPVPHRQTTTAESGDAQMGALTQRKQRLRELENKIRKAAGEIKRNGLEIGEWLCDIRDEELWDEDGYESWNHYLNARCDELLGLSTGYAQECVRIAEVKKKLPDPQQVDRLSLKAAREISRLAPDKSRPIGGGTEKDFSRLRKQDVARVLKTAAKIAEEEKPTDDYRPAAVSVRAIRKAVDMELGIDRTAKAAKTREKRDAGIELADYLRDVLGRIQGITNNLAKVPGESWELLGDEYPELATRVAEACDELAALLRS